MEASDCRYLGRECSELTSQYFVGVLHAPTPYTALGRSLEWLGYNLRQLSNQKATRSNGDLFRLAVHRVQTVLQEIRSFVQSLKVSKDKPAQWWSNFAQKARFGLKESFENLVNKVDYHAWATIFVLKACDADFVAQRRELFDHSSRAIDGALTLLLSSPLSPTIVGGPRDTDVLEKFSRNSDYYGRDIFDVANIFTPIQLAMFWAHKCTHDLRCLERSGAVPVEAYGNLLKSSVLLRRLFEDRRLENGHESHRSIIVILTEEVLYHIKNIVELNLSLPSTKQLLMEADFRIWIDDLDDYELRGDKYDTNGNEEDDSKTIRKPDQGPRPDVRTPDSDGTNQVLARPAVPHRSERRQSPNGMYQIPNGAFETQNRKVEISLHKPVDQPQNRNPEQLPIRAFVNPLHEVNGMSHSPDINRQTSNPSSTESENSRTRTHSVPWQSPPLHPPSMMPRFDVSKRKPLPDVPSPKADTHSESSRRSQSIGSTSQSHTSQQLAARKSQPPNSMQYGVPPLHTQIHQFGTHLNAQLRRPIEEDSDLQAYDPRFPPESMYSAISPSQDSMGFFNNRGLDPRDNDERPGEVQIMKDVFSKMTISASESLEFNPVWETCSVKIFRSGDQGVRMLTFRESGIDQRFILLKEAEMVPEYGYHKDLPVLWLRKIGPDSYYQNPSSTKPFSDASSATFYYRFESAQDLFNFQLAFTGEAVETDVMSARTVRFKRSLIDGEHSHYKARVQLWRETSIITGAGAQSPTTGSIAGTLRSRGASETLLKVHATRLVIYFDEVFLVLFVTDSVAIEARGKSNVLRIKPSSYRAFNNPSSVRARLLGSRTLSGGFRLDKKGLLLADEDSFDEFKWFEIDFNTEEEMSYFKSDIATILKERRRERRQVEELKRLASNGVRSTR